MRTDNKICMGLHAGKVWYLDLVICSNAQVLFSAAEDPTGNGHKGEARQAVDAAESAVWKVCSDYPRMNNDFSEWNGGRYSRDYQTGGGLAYRVLSAEPSEHRGDNEEDDAIVVDMSNAPEEIRDIVNRIVDVARAAIAEVVKRVMAEPTPYPAGYTVTSKRGMNPWATVETLAEARIEAEAARARGFDGEIWLGGEWLAEDE